MEEEVLVNIYLYGIVEAYIKYLENLSISYFFKLMESAQGMNESVCRTSKSNASTRNSHTPTARPKKSITATLNNDKGAQAFWLEEANH